MNKMTTVAPMLYNFAVYVWVCVRDTLKLCWNACLAGDRFELKHCLKIKTWM